MLVVGSRDVEVASANVVDGFVVDQKCAVGVLNGAVGGEDSVVGLDDRGRDTRSRVYGEFELRLLAVVGGEAFQEKSAKSRTSTAAEGVEDEETLQRGAVICFTSVVGS